MQTSVLPKWCPGECVLSCLPHGVSASIIPALLTADAESSTSLPTTAWATATCSSVYGQNTPTGTIGPRSLRPCRSCSATNSRAALVANPGCYPTSAILPLAPLLRAGLIEPKGTSCRLEERRVRRRAHAQTAHPLPRCNESGRLQYRRHRHTRRSNGSWASRRIGVGDLHAPSDSKDRGILRRPIPAHPRVTEESLLQRFATSMPTSPLSAWSNTCRDEGQFGHQFLRRYGPPVRGR